MWVLAGSDRQAARRGNGHRDAHRHPAEPAPRSIDAVTAILLRLLCLLFALVPAVGAWADDFLPPEEAFRFEARAADARTVEIVFTVADGYYLYREQFKFAAEPSQVVLGRPEIPPGQVKFDETFQKDVETQRGRLVIRLPVSAAPASFALKVTSQGCADQGLCYPPMQSAADVRLAGYGGDGRVDVGGGPAGWLSGGGAQQSTPSAVVPASGIAAGRGDGASLDGALRSGHAWIVVGVFFVAGVLLSFTPCVLPMLPILSSLIVGGGGPVTRARGFTLALAYSVGMALVYTALGVAAGLAGEGLAALLQTPWVLAAFAALLAALALAMFGAYELQWPAAWRDRLNASSSRLRGGSLPAVFVMGGLSALIVSPCVAAPLAGALLYISQTRDVWLGGTALLSLAGGMSVPLLLLGASAGTLLPRAGAWMEGVRRGFGWLLLAVAWWTLAPVLPAPLGVAGWGVLLVVAAALLFGVERRGEGVGVARLFARAAALVLAVAGVAQIVGALAGATDPIQPLRPFVRANGASTTADAASDAHLPFRRVASIDELEAALAQSGLPAMLDFYADWCVSCKEMERFTFSDPQVRARLDRVLLLQADVTRNDPADRALLKRFQLFGPPGIVFFDAQGRETGTRVIGYQNAERFLRSLDAAGL